MTTKIEPNRTIARMVTITVAAVTWIAMLYPAAATTKHPAPRGAVLGACARANLCRYNSTTNFGTDYGPNGQQTTFSCNKTTCTPY